jgi:hypothetical protein
MALSTPFTESLGGKNAQPIGITRLTGIAFVALGTIAIVTATLEHPKELRRIQQGETFIDLEISH